MQATFARPQHPPVQWTKLMKIGCRGNVRWEIEKVNSRPIACRHSSADTENWAKIGRFWDNWSNTCTHAHTRLAALCPGLPGLAGTRRNTHPLTPILFIRHPLSTSSIYYDPQHPLCSVYILDSHFPQPLSTSSLVWRKSLKSKKIWNWQRHRV